jgi:hypothetical protein
VFSVWSVPRCYTQDSEESSVIQVGVPQDIILSPNIVQCVCIYIFMFSESCSEVSVLLNRECWNIKINEVKTRAVSFSHRLRPCEARITLNGRNISFINLVKYIGVIFDKRITWRLHI